MTTTQLESTVDLILGEAPRLRRIALRLTGRAADADDLVQDTLLRAYRARARFKPGTSVKAWTTTILRRKFFTDDRARRRRILTETDSGSALDAVGGRAPAARDEVPLDPAALGEELDDVVKRALDDVPELHRTAFLLATVRDLTCREIGHQLRVPIGTVMSRVHRARQRLRQELLAHRRDPRRRSAAVPAAEAGPRRAGPPPPRQ
jgi:RNA polymerase sigma-70 factor (ECF subfamily)